MAIVGYNISDLDPVSDPASTVPGAYFELDIKLGPVASGRKNLRITYEQLAALIGGDGNANANLLDPYNVPLEVRNYVVDDSRVWFGPPGGEAIYLADDLPATARPGHTWDDPDANVNYLIFPVAFADRTVITCRRTALIAPTP